MTTNGSIARVETSAIAHRSATGTLEFTAAQQQMIRDTFASGASNDEFQVLMEIARVRNLNPLLRQVHFVQRWDSQKHRNVWAVQVSIDGLRAIAQRTGLYDGQDEPEFEEREGEHFPRVAKVRVYRKDWARPVVGVAHWDEYVQRTKDGKPTSMWQRMPHVMLAKCAESVAIRKAFPEDTSGLYTDAEMGQADNDRVERIGPPISPSLQRLLDDCEQVETLEQAVAVWLDHERDLMREAGGDDAPLRAARTAIVQRLEAAGVPAARTGFHKAVATAKAKPAQATVTVDAVSDEPDAALVEWSEKIAFAASLEELEAIGAQMKALPQALKDALRPRYKAKHQELKGGPPDKPRGGKRAPAPAANDDDEERAAIEAEYEDAPSASAAWTLSTWVEYLAHASCITHLQNKVAAHLHEIPLALRKACIEAAERRMRAFKSAADDAESLVADAVRRSDQRVAA